jgi:hypothetical protein
VSRDSQKIVGRTEEREGERVEERAAEARRRDPAGDVDRRQDPVEGAVQTETGQQQQVSRGDRQVRTDATEATFEDSIRRAIRRATFESSPGRVRFEHLPSSYTIQIGPLAN